METRGETEIGQLNVAVLVNKDVVGLDVTCRAYEYYCEAEFKARTGG